MWDHPPPSPAWQTSFVATAGSNWLDRLGLWPARATWFSLPLLAGPALNQAIRSRSGPVQVTVEVLAWAGWFAGLVGLLAPSTVSVTVYRILAPVTIAGLVGAMSTGDVDTTAALAAAVGTALAAGVAFLPTTGDEMVNGSAYGAERRLALRPPASLLLGPIGIAWALLASAAVAGPLLLAARNWAAGTLVTLAALALAYRAGRSLHQLARRWIVFTPAGFVIHDYFVLAESVLLRRSEIAGLGPAPAEPKGAIDLSAGALGLALQIEAREPINIAVRDGRNVVTTDTVRMIFTPALPGRLLREARLRGIQVS